MILDIETKDHDLTISYFDKAGDVAFLHLPIPKDMRYTWEMCSEDDKNVEGEVCTWDGKAVRKKNSGIAKYINKYRIGEILATADPAVVAPLHEFNTPKKYYIDIETEVLDGFADPEIANNRVTSIGIASPTSMRIFVMGLKDLTAQEIDAIEKDINKHFVKFNDHWTFQYVKYENEFEMLDTFFKKMLPSFPCVTGWNFLGYDWKYLINRCNRLNSINRGPHQKLSPELCSPSGRLMGKNSLPQHKLIVDYMEIYKKWDKVIKVRENDKLDYVGLQAVGVQKIKYNGTIKDLYEKDFVKFIFYNAVDCALVHYIDKKLNTLLTFLKLGHIAGVEANKAFSPIWIMESMMSKKFLEQKKVFVYDDKRADSTEQKTFEGAYVKEPVKGMHGWVTCYDFASLYPNTMMQFNISPETYQGKNIESKDGQVLTANNTVFDNSKDSVLRTILKDLYGQRKTVKGKYMDITKEIDQLENSLKNNYK